MRHSGLVWCAVQRQFADVAEIEFAAAQERERVELEELVPLRHPRLGQVQLRQFGPEVLQGRLVEAVEHDERVAMTMAALAGHDEGTLAGADEFVEFLFELEVENDPAADPAEGTEPVGDLQETVLIEGGDVASVQP